jgi:WD40 repeat protein
VHADTGSYGAAISPDGKHLLTGEIGGFARVWDLQTNQVKYSLQHEEGAEGGVIDADFSEHGEVLVTIEQNSIARWVVASGRLTGYWAWPGLTDVAVSADDGRRQDALRVSAPPQGDQCRVVERRPLRAYRVG